MVSYAVQAAVGGNATGVLILIVWTMVSYANAFAHGKRKMLSLNPCCSGQWSRTAVSIRYHHRRAVLILIVVDNGLVLCYSIPYLTS